MPGGLLNLISKGDQDIHFINNPTKTFFKCSYAKYTNFGKQKFRINPDYYSDLKPNTDTKLTFKFPRYAELLSDTYLVVRLPNIWSPIYYHDPSTSSPSSPSSPSSWHPYEFKWIDNIGSQMIKTIKFYIGGQIIQEYTGDYLYNLVERDFPHDKKMLYYQMTGHIPELNDPAKAFERPAYPNAFYPATDSSFNILDDNTDTDLSGSVPDLFQALGVEPSIRSRDLYIPINIWFTLLDKMAFPLVSLQFVEFTAEIELRPLNELFVVKDLDIPMNEAKYIKPKPNDERYSFYHFIHNPPQFTRSPIYTDKKTQTNNDIHLSSTYIFLSEEEQKVFALKPQKYLIKETYQYKFYDVVGSRKVELDNTSGMVSNWMWFFQRSDVNQRNEWSNYSNWPYKTQPVNIYKPTGTAVGLDANPHDLSHNYLFTTGYYKPENKRTIMNNWALIFDGKYRENEQNPHVFAFTEKYKCSLGSSDNCLYNYNFCLNTSPFEYQPSGAMNTSNFNKIEFEFSTFEPPTNFYSQKKEIRAYTDTSYDCSEEPTVIAVNRPTWNLYQYNYNLHIIEERFNILTFSSGNATLQFSR